MNMTYNNIFNNGWKKIGMFQYIKEVQKGIYIVIEERFLEYSDDKLGMSLPIWCLCRNKINLVEFLKEDGSYTEECSDILKHSYGKEEELKRIFPDKKERYLYLASLLSRNIPNNNCKISDEFKASLNEAERILTGYMETELISKDQIKEDL